MAVTKKARQESAKSMRERHIETLARAWASVGGNDGVWEMYQDEGTDSYATIRAAVYAVVPGRQKAKNIGKLLDAAVKAGARAIRRIK